MDGRFNSTLSTPRGLGWVLVALYVAIYLLPLGIRPAASPDEARYGEISREMIASGDWVSPRFNGVRYFEKPILGYWLNSVSIALFGENNFAVRLPSALAAGLTSLILFWLTLGFATRFSAYLASGIYATTILVSGIGTFAVLDSFLALFLTGALATYYYALRASPGRQRWRYLVACGGFCAGAFLTKGFLALAIPVMVVGPYLALRGQWSSILKTPWIPILIAALLIAPWAILIHLREPDYWHYFFWIEHVQRFLGDEAQHRQPFSYFFVYGPYVALPWLALLPAALVGLARGSNDRSFLPYLGAWFGLPFLFFSLSNGKLLTYILPCMAPLSILLAVGLERYLAAGRRRAFAAGSAVIALGFCAGIALVVLAQRGTLDPALFAPDESLMLWLFVACLVGGLAAAIVALVSRSVGVRLLAIAASGIALLAPLQLSLLPQWTLDSKAPSAFLAAEIPMTDDTILISDGSLFGAVAWSFKRDDVYVVTKGEIEYGLEYPESRHRLLDDAAFESLLTENRNRRDIVVVVRESTERRLPSTPLRNAERQQRSDVVMLRIRSE
jgi:4-amino-4-deoxy-L-arabinose transferase